MLADGELFFLTFYVDDILICASKTKLLAELRDKFTNSFEMKDLGEVSQYLRIKITLEDGSLKQNRSST